MIKDKQNKRHRTNTLNLLLSEKTISSHTHLKSIAHRDVRETEIFVRYR